MIQGNCPDLIAKTISKKRHRRFKFDRAALPDPSKGTKLARTESFWLLFHKLSLVALNKKAVQMSQKLPDH